VFSNKKALWLYVIGLFLLERDGQSSENDAQMGKMKMALGTTLMGVLTVMIIELFVNSVSTTGWDPVVVTMITVLVPIVVGAGLLMLLLNNMTGGD
jgi:Co/Zn/Cd efflux system component